MSAIAGVCYWDGRPISQHVLDEFARASHEAGPDQNGTISPRPGLVMQTHLLHFDQLSTTETQPYTFGTGSVLTWDGRLDNRDDLILVLHDQLQSDYSDAAVVAAAYARWGVESISHLVGDFGLAIWDADTRQLILARDMMATRPLHYLEVPGGLAWATSLDALASAFDLYNRPDDGYITSRLSFGVPHDLTPFEGLRILRGGHLLTASERGGVTIRRHFTYTPMTFRYQRAEDYTDRLRELLTEGVRVRLRVKGRMWSHLSGGWDSSSVVCLAHHLIERRAVEATSLQPLSIVSTASPESDESFYINAVERKCGLRSVRQELVRHNARFDELLGHRVPFPVLPGDTQLAIYTPIVSAGDRIVLSGDFGDGVMFQSSGHDVSLFEPLHSGHLREFVKCTFARARSRHRSLLSGLPKLALKAYAPDWHVSLGKRREMITSARTMGMPTDTASFYGVTPAVLARAPRREPSTPDITDFPIVKRALLRAVYGYADIMTGRRDPLLWVTSPFMHRPLIEFAIGIPQFAWWHPLQTRAGMHRALDGILPPEILQRTSKGGPTAAHARADIEWAAELASSSTLGAADDWELVKRGYVPTARLKWSLTQLFAGDMRHEPYVNKCVHLEAWLRTLSEAPPSARPDTWRARPDKMERSRTASSASVLTSVEASHSIGKQS